MKDLRLIDTINKRRVLILFILLALFILILATIAQLISANVSEPQVLVTLNGLAAGDKATLRLLPDGVSETLPSLYEQDIHNGRNALPGNLLNLPDGYYQLVLDVPSTYFREPKGYLFQMVAGQMVTNSALPLPLPFDLIPPSAQVYPPCNELHLSDDMDVDGETDLSKEPNIVCMAERMVSLSAPPKQGEPSGPLIAGMVFGIDAEDLVTISLYRSDDKRTSYGTRAGAGEWEMIVHPVSEGEYYTILAEAEGYISEPISYTIGFEGETPYVLIREERDEQVMDLDFHFRPVSP